MRLNDYVMNYVRRRALRSYLCTATSPWVLRDCVALGFVPATIPGIHGATNLVYYTERSPAHNVLEMLRRNNCMPQAPAPATEAEVHQLPLIFCVCRRRRFAPVDTYVLRLSQAPAPTTQAEVLEPEPEVPEPEVRPESEVPESEVVPEPKQKKKRKRKQKRARDKNNQRHGFWSNGLNKADFLQHVANLKECSTFSKFATSNRSFKRHTQGFKTFFESHCRGDLHEASKMVRAIGDLIQVDITRAEKRTELAARKQHRAELTITGPRRRRSHTLCTSCKRYIPREEYHDAKTCEKLQSIDLSAQTLLEVSVRQNFSRATRRVLRFKLGPKKCASEHDFNIARDEVRDASV
jgi:hypothetical protein